FHDYIFLSLYSPCLSGRRYLHSVGECECECVDAMGTCMSTQQRRIRGRLSSTSRLKTRKKRICGLRRRVSKGSLNEVDVPGLSDRSNPIFKAGNIEEAWFDSIEEFGSERGDDFQSVHGDVVSLNGNEGASVSSVQSSRDGNHINSDVEHSGEDVNDTESKFDGNVNEVNEAVFLDEISSKDASTVYVSKKDDGILDNFSSKTLLERPIAGSQVPFCPIDKKMLDSWSQINPSTFKVRGVNYLTDKIKEFASNYSAYYPFGVDVFLSPRKLDHIARFVELPAISSSGKFPPILVVNVQIPLYPASYFQGETDGEGVSFVLYFKLSESYSKELPLHFQENLSRLLNDEVETVKGFRVDTIVPFRDRLKILGRVVNVEDLNLSAAQRRLMQAYNEKPVLSRPQHEDKITLRLIWICIDSVISQGKGNKPEELPEQVLCCIRLNGIDYKNYQQQLLPEDAL
ncbi:hypothetical protein Lal_00007535, partial [Lupinus albus]